MFPGASVKVIQLLQHFEQLSSVFAQAVSVWSTEYGVRAIIGEIIRLVPIKYRRDKVFVSLMGKQNHISVASLFIFSEKLVRNQVKSLQEKARVSKLLRRSSQSLVLWFLN